MGIRRWLRELTAPTEELSVLGAVEAAPASAIGDLPDEVVSRISGIVHELDSAHVISPLAGVRCVWWSLKITGGPHALVRRGGVEFALTDPSGRAVIDPSHVRALVTSTHFSKCRGINRADDRQRPFLEDLKVRDPVPSLFYYTGQQTRPWLFRFAEAILVEGSPLTVAGAGQREADPDLPGRDYRTPGTRLRIAGNPTRPLYLTDEL